MFLFVYLVLEPKFQENLAIKNFSSKKEIDTTVFILPFLKNVEQSCILVSRIFMLYVGRPLILSLLHYPSCLFSSLFALICHKTEL